MSIISASFVVPMSTYSLKQSGTPELHSELLQIKMKDCLPVLRRGAQNHVFRFRANRVTRKLK